MMALRDVLGLSGEDSSEVSRIPSQDPKLFPDGLLNDAVSPGLILPGLLPKMDFLLFLSFPLLEPDEFRVDSPGNFTAWQ